MSKGQVLGEFLQFLKHEKKYWLAPFLIIFVVLGIVMIFSQSSVIGPFIYTLF